MVQARKIASIVLGLLALAPAGFFVAAVIAINKTSDATSRGYGGMIATVAIISAVILGLAALAAWPKSGPATCPHCGKEIS